MNAVKPTTELTLEGLEQREHRRAEMLRLLRTLFEDDDAEQRETFAYLQQVIEEDRPSTRSRFGAP